MSDTTKKRPKYTRRTAALDLPDIEKTLELPEGDVDYAAKQISYAEWAGLDAYLIGEVKPEADPTGANLLLERIIKASKVVRWFETGDGRFEGEKAIRAELSRPENRDMAWMLWEHVVGEMRDARSKSRHADSGDAPGEGGSADTEGSRAAALVSGL
jgi:hypothetical protein